MGDQEGEEIKEDICCLESSGTEDEANIRHRQSTPDQNVRRANLFRSNQNYGGAFYFIRDAGKEDPNKIALTQTQGGIESLEAAGREDVKLVQSLNKPAQDSSKLLLPKINRYKGLDGAEVMSINNSTVQNEGPLNPPRRTELLSLMRDIDHLVEQAKERQKQ